MTEDSHIALLLKSLPEKPGVYHFLDENGIIIYIGKAKILKRRVSSYFNKNHDSPKVRMLVSKIRDIRTTVVDSEWEALLLENSMIKQYRPKYNILLKDDKTYPWIAITKEPFPRVFATRKPDRNKQIVFGPFASVRFMNTLIETIFELYPIRTCHSMSHNGRPCLQYHIKKCAAPCANYISKEEYQSNIDKIIDIIKGNNNLVINQLKDDMMVCAEKWEFEKAQVLKEKIAILDLYRAKSVVVNPAISDCDVFSIELEEEVAYVNYLHVNEGAIVQSYTMEIKQTLEATKEELLLMAIVEIEQRFGKLSSQLILPFDPGIEVEHIDFVIPLRGDKKKLLDLSFRNVKMYIQEKKKREDLVDPERHTNRVLLQLQHDLGMANLPRRIECFDNSNTQGDEPVAAMVCFIDGKPAKKEYRHYNIKTVEGPDDFASMEEVVFRRYHRLLEENLPLPDLVIVDGGKGQLHAANTALQKLQLTDKIMLVGIAKRLEDIYKVGESLPLFINKKSEGQKLMQRLRDEVHRFGITHHRKRRSKKSIHSELDSIQGIGKVSKELLLKHFKSVKKIREASEDELSEIIGKKRTEILMSALHGKSNNDGNNS